jgi:hypothetical protein
VDSTVFGIGQGQIRETGPVCPPEDPLIREEEAPLNITLHQFLQIHEGSTRSGVTVNGLSSFSYEYTIYLTNLFIDFEITLGSLDLSAVYNATGYLDMAPISQSCFPSGNFTGDGQASLSLENLKVSGYSYISVNLDTSHISVSTFQLYELSFGGLMADFGPNYTIGGSPVDWDEFNGNVKSCFEAEMDGDSNNAVVLIIKIGRAVNEVVQDYTLDEFLDVIGGDPADCEE